MNCERAAPRQPFSVAAGSAFGCGCLDSANKGRTDGRRDGGIDQKSDGWMNWSSDGVVSMFDALNIDAWLPAKLCGCCGILPLACFAVFHS